MPLSRRRWWLFFATLCGVVLLSCGAVVLGYYLYKVHLTHRYPVRLTGGPLLQRDDEIGYIMVPHSDTEFRHLDSNAHYHVSTDRLGARVSHRGDETPERADVIILGCSFTWGWGVKNEDTYAEQLSQLTGSSVANFGVPGYSSIQSLQLLRRYLGVRPKVVVYQFINVHLERNVSPCSPSFAPFCISTAYFEHAGGAGRIHLPHPQLTGVEPLLREMVTHDRSLSDMLLAATWAMRADLFRYVGTRAGVYDDSPENMDASIHFAISEMAKTTRAIGAELIVLYIPNLTPSERPWPPPGALVRAVADTQAIADSRVLFVDLTPVIVAHREERPEELLSLTAEDNHPNPMAYRLIAEQLAIGLQEPR